MAAHCDGGANNGHDDEIAIEEPQVQTDAAGEQQIVEVDPKDPVVAPNLNASKTVRMLTVIDEFTRRCMAVVVERRLNSDNVLHCLTELFVQHGPPDHIRSDNGSEFTAHAVRDWLGRIGVKTLYIEPGSPWENGYNESFNSKLRDEILNTEIFYRAPLRIGELPEDIV